MNWPLPESAMEAFKAVESAQSISDCPVILRCRRDSGFYVINNPRVES